jgi:NADPH:quinone reductase-like Zn-dependent oxidoreductase
MKAFYQTAYGGPEADHFGNLPDPVAGEGELLIEVKAVSINPVDYKVKSGMIRLISGSKFPKILGSDFAGVVKTIPSGTENFKAGDRVYGAVSVFTGKPGALSELVAVNQKFVRLIPEGMSFEEAASLPVASLTALNGLRRGDVTAGSRVLINGATGGVGHFAVQIAKAKGAHVTATCSDSNRQLAKDLGADEITGYKKEDMAKVTGKFNAILDAYGKMDYADVCRLLEKKGVYASTMFMPWSVFSSFFVKLVYGKKLTSSNMRGLPEDYEEIEKLFNEKKLKPLIENRYSLEKASEAFVFAEKGKPRGKIIITV